MKTKDITVGEEYAVLDSPTARRRGTPRKALVVETGVVAHYGNKTIKVKLVTPPHPGYSYYGLDGAKENDVRTIRAAQILGPWADFAEKVKEETAVEAARIAKRQGLEDRFTALGVEASILVYYDGVVGSATLRSEQAVLALLALAERGFDAKTKEKSHG